MKKIAVLSLSLLGASLLGSAVPAAATDISLESRTYLPLRGTDGGNTHAPIYEYLTFAAEDLAQAGLYLRAAGWGRADLADETFDKKSNSELQYAYLGWRAPVLNAELRAGRVSVTSGVARHEVLDGLLLGSDLPAGFDVTLYGGVPIEVGEVSRSQDSIFGGRLSQGLPGVYRLGASYLKERDGGSDNREEAGSDLFLAPLPLVQLTGTSLYNVKDKKWARHDYRLVLGPFAKTVRLAATWAKTDYTAYFTEPLNRALLPVEDKTHTRVGGELELLLGLGFAVTGEYLSFTASEGEDDGTAYGARLEWSGTSSTAGAGFRQVNGEAEEDQYLLLSAHATTRLGPVLAALGAEHLTYEVEINGRKTATIGTIGLTYAATAALELSASGEYGRTPEYDREVKGTLAVVWRYDAAQKKGAAK